MTILAGEEVSERGIFYCEQCHREVQVDKGRSIPKCPHCGHDIFSDGGAEDTIH
jgi:DNA-directed RNA polymerase subunit RPC12/RpoP